MKKALFVSIHYPPYVSVSTTRYYSLIRHLQNFGWMSDVIVPNVSNLFYYDESWQKRFPVENDVYMTPYFRAYLPVSVLTRIIPQRWASYVNSFFMVPDAFIGWYPFLLREGRRLLKKTYNNQPYYNALITTSPPFSIQTACLRLKRQFGIPWLVDLRDPWVDNPMWHGVTNWHKQLRIKQELDVIQNCDAVVVTSDQYKQRLHDRYPKYQNKIHIVRNGFDKSSYGEEIQKNSSRKTINFFHGGTLLPRYNIEPFLRGVCEYINLNKMNEKDINFNFYGNVSEEKLIKKYGLGKIVIEHDRLSHDKFIQKLQESDVAVLICTPIEEALRGDLFVPSKLYEYIGAQKPLLALAQSEEIKKIVKGSGLGFSYDPEDSKGIACGIEKLVDIVRNKSLMDSADQDYINQFEYVSLTEKFSKILTNIVKA